MKITALETVRVEEFPNLLWVRVFCDSEIAGLGETFFGPRATEAFLHETAAPLLLGESPADIERLNRKLQTYVGFRGSGAEMRGLSAADIALWDLRGKILGAPLCDLLGGRCRDAVKTYNTCAGSRYVRSARGQKTENWGLDAKTKGGDFEDLDAFLNRADELAEDLLSQGISAMKIWPLDSFAEKSDGRHVAPEDLKRGLEPFRKIRRAVGDKMEVMLECHGLWDVPAAVEVGCAAAEYSPHWIEDPVRQDSMSALAEARAAIPVRVAAGETVAGLWGFRDMMDARAADVVILDLGWTGGITQARKIAALAEAHGLPVAPHDCTGPAVFGASAHFSAAAPNAFWQESVRAFYNGWFNEVARGFPKAENGMIRPPDAPGHGVELNPDLFKRDDCIIRASKMK